MCLATFQKKPIRISKERKVYKLFDVVYRLFKDSNSNNSILSSPFQNFTYLTNKLYETDIQICSYRTGLFDTGFESRFYDTDSEYLMFVSQGFHFMTNRKTAVKYFNYRYTTGRVLVECIVPAGSDMYTNPAKLGVSNSIIVTDKIVCAWKH